MSNSKFNLFLFAAILSACHTVTPSAGPKGRIAPSTPQIVLHSETKNFTVTPDLHYDAVMSGDCGGFLSGNIFTTNQITMNCSVVANFIRSGINTDDSVLINGVIYPPYSGTDPYSAENYLSLMKDPKCSNFKVSITQKTTGTLITTVTPYLSTVLGPHEACSFDVKINRNLVKVPPQQTAPHPPFQVEEFYIFAEYVGVTNNPGYWTIVGEQFELNWLATMGPNPYIHAGLRMKVQAIIN